MDFLSPLPNQRDENTLKYRLLFQPSLFLWYVTVIVIIELNCQSVGILSPEIVLSFTLSLTGEMRLWNFALGWEIIIFFQNQDTWHLHKCWWVKKKWLLHLGNLAQTSKTFPNIISKITQHNQLLAKHKIIDLLMVRVTLNGYTSNFEFLDWDKHRVPDAIFEIVSLFFYYTFFRISVVLSSRNKARM